MVKEKQKECSGQVIRGRSFYEDGKLVFETVTNISSAHTKKLGDMIKKETGLTLKAGLRQAEKVEEIENDRPDVEEESAEEEREDDRADEPEASADAGAAFTDRLKAWLSQARGLAQGSSFAQDINRTRASGW